MVTTPKPRPREHQDALCLCRHCKRTRLKLRQLGHYAPEPWETKNEYPNLEAEIRELF